MRFDAAPDAPMNGALANLLERAVAAHQAARLPEALELYDVILQTDPQHFDALHLSGVIARQQGQPERAVRLIKQAIAVRDDQAIAYCNLGAALQDLDNPDAACAAYERALAIRADYPMALTNLGNARRKLGRFDEALLCYARALALEPAREDAHIGAAATLLDLLRFSQALLAYRAMVSLGIGVAHAWMGIGAALQGQGHDDDALKAYQKALALDTSSGETYFLRATLLARMQRYALALESLDLAMQWNFVTAGVHLARGDALRNLGEQEAAVFAYEAARAAGADDEIVTFRQALAGAGATPGKAPRADVEKLFDRYAGKFEAHLLGPLEYRAPFELMAALRDAVAAPVDAALDLGCGTGLAGVDLRPLVKRLVGLDLSRAMLDKARARAIYDELVHDDALDYLARTPERFDIVVATDVLVYIGELASLFAAIRARLTPGGRFAFTTEDADGDTVTLRSTGRFAHPRRYVEQQLKIHLLGNNIVVRHGSLRREGDAMLSGSYWIVQ